MSYPTLEQVRTSANPLQATGINDYYVIIDRYTNEYASYKKITTAWTDAQCDGFMFIIAGADHFERVITTPYLNVKWFGAIGNNLSHPVSAQINPGTGLVFANLTEVHGYYPTAVSMSDEIDGLAIQNAINFAIYDQRTGGTKYVWLPSGTYLTSDTMHMGYGETFTSVVLQGGTTYAYDVNNSNQKGATILPQFGDRPALNLQGQRESMVQGVSIVGRNTANPGYNNLTWWDPTKYLQSGLGANADSRYAPYAGITIDAYGGSTPSPAYPTVTYPVIPNALGINVTGQYSKVTSSRIQIDHCKVTNFIVGIVQQPSGVEANGDFIKTTHTSVNNCKYGISSSGGQARLSEISNCNLDTCWILVTNSVHGAQRGRINLIQNTHFSGYQMLQFIETAWNNQLILRDCYCESTFKIGYFGANRTNACNLTIDNCDLNFDHSKGVPSVLVQTGSFAKITIKGGRIVSGPTLLASFGKIELNGVSVTIDCTASIGLAGNNITTWSNFLTFTCGLPAMSAFYPGKDMKDCLLGVNGLSADLTATGIGNAVGYEGSADFNTDPAHVIGGYFDNTGHLGSTYRLSTGPGVGNYPTGAMFSARVLTIPSNYLFSSRLVSVSDCLVDRSNSTLWLVLSTNATTTVLLLLNGFQLNSDMSVNFYETPSIVTSPISTTGNDAVMHTGFNRNYAMATGTDGQLALIGDCTSGTALISNITSANGLSGPVAGQFACIDASKFLYVYLISGTDPTVRTSSWQGPFRVVSINTTTFQMQLDANINGITGKVYLFNASLYQ